MQRVIRAVCAPFGYLRNLYTFCCKLFGRIIFAYRPTSICPGRQPIAVEENQESIPESEPTEEDGENQESIPEREPTEEDGENQESIPEREPTEEDGENQESIPEREPTEEDGENQRLIPEREPTEEDGENQRLIPEREPTEEDGENQESIPNRKRKPTDDQENTRDHDPYQVEPTDLLYCGYDTTWETSGGPQRRRPRGSTQRAYDYQFNRFENAAKDMYNYRHDYPLPIGRRSPRSKGEDMPNLKFYLGKRASEPDGFFIDEFHKEWHSEYSKLEGVHSFVQWIFPLQEVGMNYEAFVLTKQEIEAFLKDETAKLNLQNSYCLMLDFYGIELSNLETGEARRAKHWRERFENMDRHTHNNLRLTRILKCLGTLGFRHYQAPLVRFFLEETLVYGNLPAVKESVLNYFLFAVLDRAQRRELVRFAFWNYEPREEFIWCPKKIQEAFLLEGRLAGRPTLTPSLEELSIEGGNYYTDYI